jgi:DnaJ-class molecular chaperone
MRTEKVIHFNSVTYIEFQCQICGQKGFSPYSDGVCPRCQGKGKIVQRVNPGRYVEKTCRVCTGTGHNPYSNSECAHCHGSGKEYIPLN